MHLEPDNIPLKVKKLPLSFSCFFLPFCSDSFSHPSPVPLPCFKGGENSRDGEDDDGLFGILKR